MRERLMIEETRLTIKIMGKPKQTIKDKIDMEFGPKDGLGFVSQRGDTDGYFLSPEIIANLEGYKRKGES
jgi:hypothetical protein